MSKLTEKAHPLDREHWTHAYIAAQVDKAPPLTVEQRDRLRVTLHPTAVAAALRRKAAA
ncbi:MAG: hypothetical protein L0G99_13085 [Propionibacteriales bacterium]|nr:hypothetical protein [Propionibacteriales bacterium]